MTVFGQQQIMWNISISSMKWYNILMSSFMLDKTFDMLRRYKHWFKLISYDMNIHVMMQGISVTFACKEHPFKGLSHINNLLGEELKLISSMTPWC